jgi:probable HAF family extracellular repeat protein
MKISVLSIATAVAFLLSGAQIWAGVWYVNNVIAQGDLGNSLVASIDNDKRYVRSSGYSSSGKIARSEMESTIIIQNDEPSGFSTLQNAKYEIVDLGAEGWFTATRINDFGQVIGYRYFDGKGQQPFFYEDGLFIDLSKYEIYPRGINDKGQVVGSNDNTDILIFYDSSISNLGNLFMDASTPNGINNNTHIVGVNNSPPAGYGYNAFVYDGDKLLYIYNLTDHQQTVAHDINNHNHLVGRIDVGLDPEDEENIEGLSGQSFIYENGSMTFFGDPGRATQAYSINDLGQTVGVTDQFGNGDHAFLYKNGRMVNIDTLNSHRSLGLSVNSFGHVVGRFTPPSLEYSHAFIYDGNVMVDLNDLIDAQTGWDYLDEATDINNKGQIVGIGYIDGETHTFLLYPVNPCKLKSVFSETTIEENSEYYTDRDYMITVVPPQYMGMQMIKTPNDHRLLTMASGYMTFKMPYDGYVFVAYDDKADREPNWLNDFYDTGDFLKTSLTISPAHRLYRKKYDKNECVNLGGNRGPGFSGDEKIFNYIVLYHPTGSLEVTLSPQDAVNSGARWRVDGGNWNSSSELQRDLLVSDHTVEFKTVTNWNAPEKMKVTIKQEETTQITATYDVATGPTGSLKVNIKPSEAVSVGVEWRVDGGNWRDGGFTETGIDIGPHTVEFKTIAGWTAPSNKKVIIDNGKLTTITGTYIQQTGSLTVSIKPSAARSAGAQWRVDGGSWRNSGDEQDNLPLGSHTIEFKAISDWATPGDQLITIKNNETTTRQWNVLDSNGGTDGDHISNRSGISGCPVAGRWGRMARNRLLRDQFKRRCAHG